MRFDREDFNSEVDFLMFGDNLKESLLWVIGLKEGKWNDATDLQDCETNLLKILLLGPVKLVVLVLWFTFNLCLAPFSLLKNIKFGKM